jgi:poly(A) polymerase/tRNA nucleotidyltransferase (CCA-adding enzyme)
MEGIISRESSGVTAIVAEYETGRVASRLPDFLADPGLLAVLGALPRARLVGGCVRDALCGAQVSDIDLATPDLPEEIVAALGRAGLRSIPTGIAHGTVTALAGGRGFEITTLRRDVATDGRHAVVAFTDDWQVDAARRDFTINAMSMTASGEVFDYFGGLADLAAGVVRFVGDAGTRIAEDYLRILRFFRFFARYSSVAADADAVAAIASHVGGLAGLSAERVWSELKRILAAAAPDAALGLMGRTGVFDAVLPGAVLVSVDELPADPLLRLAALRPGPGLAERLKLSGEEAEVLAGLAGPPPPEGVDDAGLRRLLADVAPAILAGRARLAGRDAGLIARIEGSEVPVFPLQGRDLIAAGVRPGPAMGVALKRLRGVWLESGCVADREALLGQLAGPPAA